MSRAGVAGLAVLAAAPACAAALVVGARLEGPHAGALVVALETALLARLCGHTARRAALGGVLAGACAGLALWYLGAVLGPAYPALHALARAPWPAVVTALVFGVVARRDLAPRAGAARRSGA